LNEGKLVEGDDYSPLDELALSSFKYESKIEKLAIPLEVANDKTLPHHILD
jgi:hypothetical protein